jgi:hypothetical protein
MSALQFDTNALIDICRDNVVAKLGVFGTEDLPPLKTEVQKILTAQPLLYQAFFRCKA